MQVRMKIPMIIVEKWWLDGIVSLNNMYDACRTPSEAIEPNRNKLHRTKVACNRPPPQFICDDRKLTTIRIAPLSVIMQKHLAVHNTTGQFDWLYILPMNNMLQASCKTLHTKWRDWIAIWNLNLRNNSSWSSRTSCNPPHNTRRRDCTV